MSDHERIAEFLIKMSLPVAHTAMQAMEDLLKLVDERDRLRGALEWYGDTVAAMSKADNQSELDYQRWILMTDGAEYARLALEGKGDE